ncbi:hypothetical protein J132_01465 [Termitomyces sp. J132]|nr:hypothetical protein J132_01465 [Termitomyces sp. J132]
MTLIKNTITTTPSPAHADQKGTQIHPRTLRERRNVKRFTHLEPCPLALWSADERFMQPEGHLQATVIMPNISRKRGAPATAAPTAIPTPLSFPCTTITPHSPYNPPSPAYANQKGVGAASNAFATSSDALEWPAQAQGARYGRAHACWGQC